MAARPLEEAPRAPQATQAISATSSDPWFLSWAQSPLEIVQRLVDWGEFILGSAGAEAELGARGPGGCGAFQGACLPLYRATCAEALELRRSGLGLALVGELTVVTCRLLTGNVGGAVVGLCIFAVGNRARCSLHPGSLTSYILLGGSAGAWDALDLVHQILSSGLFALPVGGHVSFDLSALAALLAPVVEAAGARVAWDSYVEPSLLFADAGGGSASGPARAPSVLRATRAQPGRAAAQIDLGEGPPPWLGGGWQPLVQTLAAGALRASRVSRQPGAGGSLCPPAPRRLMGSAGALIAHGARRAKRGFCGQCGADASGAWEGLGAYQGEVYCQRCWRRWAAGGQ